MKIWKGAFMMTKEQQNLIGMLKRYATEINQACGEYHASVDKSGTTPQLSIK